MRAFGFEEAGKVSVTKRPVTPRPWAGRGAMPAPTRGVWAESGHDIIVDTVRDAVASGRLHAGAKLAPILFTL